MITMVIVEWGALLLCCIDPALHSMHAFDCVHCSLAALLLLILLLLICCSSLIFLCQFVEFHYFRSGVTLAMAFSDISFITAREAHHGSRKKNIIGKGDSIRGGIVRRRKHEIIAKKNGHCCYAQRIAMESTKSYEKYFKYF